MSQDPHYFIAVPLPEDVKQWLKELQGKIKTQEELHYHSWTHVEDFHITLKFLGAVSDDTFNHMIEYLKNIKDMPRLSLTPSVIGSFGNPNKPRVLWMGVQENPTLSSLYSAVEDKCVDAGFNKETRPYRPHITIGKKWKHGNKIDEDVMAKLNKLINNRPSFQVDHFVIYQINPSQSPKYKAVKTFKLS
ncbi:RNA 2',3'-cyclic phosphodiesterase [Aquibacillus koreensis]|uniref:RNA 2',3'-cyclic phosphodiesterase n=1 Tax=Aquibacillus koreensis TaxID=279446 RepID=A0A9X4AIF0_9BACI|nr:RNA 2',3'-cyclic phosphodiesterase [Aquibacillus koreensis]MCT2535033.1 RNA 2',3'-cyclic phosphodiesterase [Aquibacillus koreensis]MDC3419320.1 RNA 2',3'-cyclic phosphodiesterase [Aquibacillus koreensis]